MTTQELPVSEADFTTTVVEIFQMCGWKVCHIRQSRREVVWTDKATGEKRSKWVGDPGTEGFPDILCLKDGSQVIAELKVGKNKPTKAQREWLSAFELVSDAAFKHGILPIEPVRVFLWTPDDMETIKKLAGARG